MTSLARQVYGAGRKMASPQSQDLTEYFSAQSNPRTPIHHVIYVIKENRTYDQVLGDVKEGNGAPDLVLFGEQVTPNQHALARQFVLFDNFYVDGDVSADGHLWSTAASSTDYVNKVWPGSIPAVSSSISGARITTATTSTTTRSRCRARDSSGTWPAPPASLIATTANGASTARMTRRPRSVTCRASRVISTLSTSMESAP